MGHRKHRIQQETMYYVLLFVLLLFTAGISFMLLPILYFAGNLWSVIITAILGLAFGLFIAYFVKDLDLITHHHHAGIWGVFLAGSILNFGIIYWSKLSLYEQLPIFTNAANPLLVALTFALSFFIPSFFIVAKHAERRRTTAHRR